MYSKTIEIDQIGPVLFEESKRAKHLNISIRPPARIRIAVPVGTSFENAIKFLKNKERWIKKTIDKVQSLLIEKKQFKEIDKKYATNYLLQKLDNMATMHGFIYNNAKIRNQKTRWGSCSIKNNINLNMQLINLPIQLIEYVLLHELVHTLVKNHSPLFWNTLNKFVENPRHLDKQLKKYYLF